MKTIMYMHSGSGNHGCEAIVRTLKDILELKDVVLDKKNKYTPSLVQSAVRK